MRIKINNYIHIYVFKFLNKSCFALQKKAHTKPLHSYSRSLRSSRNHKKNAGVNSVYTYQTINFSSHRHVQKVRLDIRTLDSFPPASKN